MVLVPRPINPLYTDETIFFQVHQVWGKISICNVHHFLQVIKVYLLIHHQDAHYPRRMRLSKIFIQIFNGVLHVLPYLTGPFIFPPHRCIRAYTPWNQRPKIQPVLRPQIRYAQYQLTIAQVPDLAQCIFGCINQRQTVEQQATGCYQFKITVFHARYQIKKNVAGRWQNGVPCQPLHHPVPDGCFITATACVGKQKAEVKAAIK